MGTRPWWVHAFGRGLAMLAAALVTTGVVAESVAQNATPEAPPATIQPYTPPEGIGGVGGSITID